jgi:hypothetical protein
MQAEESLLPYQGRAHRSRDMSDAINGLAAGGNPQGPSAAAGIHFQPSDFQFNAPDFKYRQASQPARHCPGLTNYRPVEGSYQTADYSGINLPSSDDGVCPRCFFWGAVRRTGSFGFGPREYATASVRLRLFGASPRLAQSPDLCYANPGGLRVSPRSRTYHPRSPARWV